MSCQQPAPAIEVRLTPAERRAALEHDVLTGLGNSPRNLVPTWLYDERGCELFDEITRLDEYYPTRAERSILVAHADAIAETSGADTLVELGSGTSEKTRLLLDALRRAGRLRRFVAFDVAEATLREAADGLLRDYPGLVVGGVVGDFGEHLCHLPGGGVRMVAFLGGTIGNLEPDARARFLAELAGTLAPGDTVLVGTDLIKDRARLEAAYDDAQGVTAAFNRNVLEVLNRELGADFDLDAFEHVARFDEPNSWMEMRLRSTRDQTVTISDLGLKVAFVSGEELRTEISAKFTREGVDAELRAQGLEPVGQWTDDAGDFALTLARR